MWIFRVTPRQPVRETRRHSWLAALLVGGLSLAWACGESPPHSPVGPTQMGPTSLVVARAAVMIGGDTLSNGSTFHHTHAADLGPSRFEAQITAGDGRPAMGVTALVEVTRPGGMMMTGTSAMRLYDDGTHGDPVPSDGVYCYEDVQGAYGFHRSDAPHGQYQYDFHAEFGGVASGHMIVTIQVTG